MAKNETMIRLMVTNSFQRLRIERLEKRLRDERIYSGYLRLLVAIISPNLADKLMPQK